MDFRFHLSGSDYLDRVFQVGLIALSSVRTASFVVSFRLGAILRFDDFFGSDFIGSLSG